MRAPQFDNGVAVGTIGARGDVPAALVVRGHHGGDLRATGCPSRGAQYVEIVAPSAGGRWRSLFFTDEPGARLFVSERRGRIALERERYSRRGRPVCTAVELVPVEDGFVEGEPVRCHVASRLRGDLSCYAELARTDIDPLAGLDGL